MCTPETGPPGSYIAGFLINEFEALDNFIVIPAIQNVGGGRVSGQALPQQAPGTKSQHRLHRAEEEHKKRKEKKALGCLPVCLSFIMRHIPHL
jgi:hypothetical protein